MCFLRPLPKSRPCCPSLLSHLIVYATTGGVWQRAVLSCCFTAGEQLKCSKARVCALCSVKPDGSVVPQRDRAAGADLDSTAQVLHMSKDIG